MHKNGWNRDKKSSNVDFKRIISYDSKQIFSNDFKRIFNKYNRECLTMIINEFGTTIEIAITMMSKEFFWRKIFENLDVKRNENPVDLIFVEDVIK